MTTPGTHNDTYAESYHRDVRGIEHQHLFYLYLSMHFFFFFLQFFANYAAGKPPSECAGEEGHDTASMGGYVVELANNNFLLFLFLCFLGLLCCHP